MGRNIENDHAFTQDEIDYWSQRGSAGEREIKLNQKNFGDQKPPEIAPDRQDESLKLDQDIFEYVRDLSIAEAKSELKKLDLTTRGDAQTVRIRLATTLQKARDAGN